MKLIIEEVAKATTKTGKPFYWLKIEGKKVMAWPNQVNDGIQAGDTIEGSLAQADNGMRFYKLVPGQFSSSPSQARAVAPAKPGLCEVETLENSRMILQEIRKIKERLEILEAKMPTTPKVETNNATDDDVPF